MMLSLQRLPWLDKQRPHPWMAQEMAGTVLAGSEGQRVTSAQRQAAGVANDEGSARHHRRLRHL